MKPAAIIVTITALLATAAPAQAQIMPQIREPQLTLSRDNAGIEMQTSYLIPSGHAAEITYIILRHRTDRAGFKVVGTVTHVVATADGVDTGLIRWSQIGGRWNGFGYRVRPVLVDVSNALRDTAHAGKIHA